MNTKDASQTFHTLQSADLQISFSHDANRFFEGEIHLVIIINQNKSQMHYGVFIILIYDFTHTMFNKNFIIPL